MMTYTNYVLIPPHYRTLVPVILLVIFAANIPGISSGQASETLSADSALPSTAHSLITPLFSQVAAGGGTRDIKTMPDGSRKMRCPACGDYHLDVPADVPTDVSETETVPPVPMTPPPFIGVPFDSLDAGNPDGVQSPSDDTLRDESSEGWKTETAAIAATSSLATAGIAAIGAGLMMFGMGLTPREILEGLTEWVTSSPPVSPTFPPDLDEFEQWRHCLQSRGWKYSESGGVAEFVPVEGATDEQGRVYSEARREFVAPGETRQPPPLPSQEDAVYREEVRLMQEDLKRHQDLLDREKERLRHYGEAGLDSLLEGTNERIQEYKKLVDLSQAELKRLNESTSLGRGDAQPILEPDLKAEAAERLKTQEAIKQLRNSKDAVNQLKTKDSIIQHVGTFDIPSDLSNGEGI
jgi:hypothetical protein